MKIIKELGCYVTEEVCTECDWVACPRFLQWFPSPPRAICPKCAGKLKYAVGQWRIKTIKRFLRETKTEYIEFIRKQ